jgi:hypothetical protein
LTWPSVSSGVSGTRNGVVSRASSWSGFLGSGRSTLSASEAAGAEADVREP